MERNRRQIQNEQEAKKKVAIIDCYNLAYKAAYTSGGLRTENEVTGTMFGFLNQIFTLANNLKTNQFIFAWDSRRSIRKKIYLTYKANREEKDPQKLYDLQLIHQQINLLRTKIIPTMGFKHNWIQTGYEADDIIATTVMAYPGNIIVSTDNDLWQLLDFADLYNSSKKTTITAIDFKSVWGIPTQDWALVKAMAGCATDNVEGINGIGEITAAKFLRGILPNGKMKERILHNEDVVNRNMSLVSLPLKGCKTKKINFEDESFNFDDWIEIFNQYQFASFLKKNSFDRLKDRFKTK